MLNYDIGEGLLMERVCVLRFLIIDTAPWKAAVCLDDQPPKRKNLLGDKGVGASL